MLTLLAIIFVICYFSHKTARQTSDEKHAWNIAAWILIILIVLHGC
jgi:hypothetical protein